MSLNIDKIRQLITNDFSASSVHQHFNLRDRTETNTSKKHSKGYNRQLINFDRIKSSFRGLVGISRKLNPNSTFATSCQSGLQIRRNGRIP